MLNWVPFGTQSILWIIAILVILYGTIKGLIGWFVGKRNNTVK